MSLIIFEGFDGVSDGSHLTSGGKWAAGTGPTLSSGGRNGGQAMVGYTSSVRKYLTAAEEDDLLVVGFAYSGGLGYAGHILLGSDGGVTNHVRLGINANGSLTVYRWSTVALGTTDPGLIQQLVYAYIELKVRLHDTAGEVVLRVNGVEQLNLTGVDTKNAGTKTVFDFADVAVVATSSYVDDVYILNEQGTTNNDFLGDCRVEAIRPNGNGNTSQLVGSDGNSVDNYALVNETATNDATWAGSGTDDEQDTYSHGNLAVTAGNVLGVQEMVRAAKTDTGAKSVALVARSGVSEDASGDQALGTGWGWYRRLMETKPGGGAWAIADVNGAEFGARVRP